MEFGMNERTTIGSGSSGPLSDEIRPPILRLDECPSGREGESEVAAVWIGVSVCVCDSLNYCRESGIERRRNGS